MTEARKLSSFVSQSLAHYQVHAPTLMLTVTHDCSAAMYCSTVLASATNE